MAIRITALGSLRVERDGQGLERLPAKRLRLAILLYLAVEREATREQLMGTFWGDRPPDRARHLLSQTLYELRQDLGDGWMTATGEQVCATPALTVDAVEFAEAVEEERFEDALSLYGGGFLSGATLGVSREFEGWVDRQEGRVARLHRRARRGAIDGLAAAQRLEPALSLAREWVELDPLDDDAQHRLIELMAATGDRSGALRQYDRYAELVESQLELEPLEVTRALVEQIRQGSGLGDRPGAPVTAVTDVPLVSDDDATFPDPVPPAPPEPDPRADAGPTPLPAGPERRESSFAPRRRRPVVRWTVVYLAMSMVVLGVVGVVSTLFSLPAGVMRALILLLAFGALVVHGAAWLRRGYGEAPGWVEAGLAVAVVVFAGVLTMLARAPEDNTLEAGEPDADAASEERVLPPRRIAVLYLEDVSTDQSLRALATGFTDALIQELGAVEGLDVLSRTAVAPYRDHPVRHDVLVSDLGAGTLVAGNIARVDDRIRVSVQLIDGARASQLMSATLSAPFDSLTWLLDELPREVARMLRESLGAQIELVESRRGTRNGLAWQLVQRAEELVEDGNRVRWRDREPSLALLERADSLLQRAAEMDPGWPEPRLRQAKLIGLRAQVVSAVPSRYDVETAREGVRQLDSLIQAFPEYAPAYQERGILRFELAEEAEDAGGYGMYEDAESDLRRALVLDASLSRAWWGLSELLRRVGSFVEAKASAERALEVDAFLANALENLWYLFGIALENQDFDEARHWCDELRSRYGHSQHWGFCRLMLMESAEGSVPDADSAWAAADTIVALSSLQNRPIYQPITALHVAKVLTRAGRTDSARAVFQRAFPDSVPGWATYDAAHLYVMLGDDDRALEFIERHLERHPTWARSMAQDWWFRRLQGDPRFDRLVGAGPD